MFDLRNWPLTWVAAAAIPLLGLYLYQRLCFYRFKQFEAVPQPAPPSLLWGSLQYMGQLMGSGDPRAHLDVKLLGEMDRLGWPPMLLVDLRPVSYPMLVVTSHDVAEQVSRPSKRFASSVPKSPTLGDIWTLTGRNSILLSEGDHWKAQRKRLSPGFAPQNLMTYLPAILDKTKLFLGHLDRLAATGEEFRYDELCTNLTFDIIGAVTMDLDFNAQVGGKQSEILNLFRTISASFHDLKGPEWRIFNMRKFRDRARNSSRLGSLLQALIRQEYDKISQGKGKARSVLTLSLEGTEELTDELVQQTGDNLRTFLFAGHDTTSILLQWAAYELARTPNAQRALRHELDELFGTDPDPAIIRQKLLSDGDSVLSRMTYTSAVIKEALRLHPPAGSARMAPKGSGATIRLPDGQEQLVDGVIIYISHGVIQRDPAVYGETKDDFIPERWLGGKENIPAGAWRPFERGPRNCIGQELANIEARVILACVARRYDFVKVGQGEFELDEKGRPILDEKGFYRTKSTLFNAIQVTAKPVDGTLMQVKLSEQAIQSRPGAGRSRER